MPKRRDEQAPYWQQLRVAEKGIIEYALEHGVTIRGTATILGISPNYLGERLRLLGIPIPDVRPGPKPGTKRPAAPKLTVVPETPPEETLDEEEEEDEEEDEEEEPEDGDSDVLEDESEEGSDDDDDEAGDPWDGNDDEDEDEDDGDGEEEDASAQGN